MPGRRRSPPGERPPVPPPLTWQELPVEAFVGGKREDKGTAYASGYFEKNPDRIVSGALNNFHAKFSGGRARALHQEALREMPDLEDDLREQGLLFSAIDQATREVGADLGRIKDELNEIERLHDADKEDEALALYRRVREEIIPVYKRLRELGYTHSQLIK